MTLPRRQFRIPEKNKESRLRKYIAEGYQYVNADKNKKQALVLQSTYNVEEHFNIIFDTSLYNFLNFIIPPNKELQYFQTQFSAKIQRLDKNYFYREFKTYRTVDVIKKLLNNEYDRYEGANDLKKIYAQKLKTYDHFLKFSLRFKDSSGNLYSETEPRAASIIQPKKAYVLPVPMDDTSVVEKTGFDAAEEVYIYYYNTYYDKEYLLLINNDNITAALQSFFNITSIDISFADKYDFNPNF